MSEMPRNSDGSSKQCKAGPDFFSFYACQIADLLSEDKNTLSNSNASELSQGKYMVVNDKESMDCSPKDVDSLFENNIGAELSDFKKGRLKGLLRQSVNDLSMEVDEAFKFSADKELLREPRVRVGLFQNSISVIIGNHGNIIGKHQQYS
ncbi:hypothetical protein V6Z12_D10G127600 [Gossypium hirsutum]